MAADVPIAFPADDEVDGFWSQDRIHAPRALSPLACELITDTLAIGFTRAHREIGAPLDMLARSVNGYLFTSLRPPTDAADLALRAARYVELPRVLDTIGDRWLQEWQPQLEASVRAGRVADYRHLSNIGLDEELQRQREHMIEQWTIHGRINFGTVAAARFIDFYDEVVKPAQAAEAYQLLQGFVTQTVRASDELWRLSRIVRGSAELRAVFDRPTPEVVATLQGAGAGANRAVAGFASEFEAFLDEYGWRSDAVFDVADVTWREDPSIPVDSLRSYVAMGDEHDPRYAFERAVHRREELLAAARRRLADDPERLATFERYYDAGRHNLTLTEDHAFWIDQSGVANFRRFLLQLGDRLAVDGCVAGADDVFFLARAEIGAALRSGGDWREAVAVRRAAMVAATAVAAPRTLGVAPPPTPNGIDPIVDAIVNRLGGRRPPPAFDSQADLLTGHGASPGVVTGTARVVTSLADAAKLGDGEILVCEMTLPPWVPLFAVAAAVVADTGGMMSHTAIVAREFELPAVVGTQVGTKLIADGMTVTVDGRAGHVRLHRP